MKWIDGAESEYATVDPGGALPNKKNCGVDNPSGEQRLMWAVFVDALSILTSPRRRGFKHKKAFREAADWVNQPGNGPFSFGYICDEFGLDASSTRRALQPYITGTANKPMRQFRTNVVKSKPLSV
jgi:hypothetical protein